jgi:SAM-dependent methyltransferase
MTLLDQFLAPRLRDYWVRLALRRVHYADRADKLERLYRVEDPWHMGSAKEQARFDWTNRLISTHLAPLDTILEIGCGEGHQSQYLSQVCGRLYGIDVSSRAVRRARKRCLDAKFAVGDPFDFCLPEMPPAVDLVVACEVLYYVKDVPRFLERISGLGRACLVTYYQGQAAALEPHLVGLGDCSRAQFWFEDTEWNALWWRNRGSKD